MATSLRPSSYICKACWQSASPSLKRTFTSTSQRRKAVPTFTPTSSPSFDALLSQYRETLFVPTSLSQHHQRLLYRPSRQSILTADQGVTVFLTDDEDVRLTPQKYTDRPSKRESLRQIAEEVSSSDEEAKWANVIPFFEAFKSAGQVMPRSFPERLARHSFQQGQQRVMIRAVEMASKTGVSLRAPDLTRLMMLGCHLQAAEAGFKGEGLAAAVKTADHLTSLLERKEHCAGTLGEKDRDMRTSLMVNGVLLELHAAQKLAVESTATDPSSVAQVTGDLTRVLKLSEAGFDEAWVHSTKKLDHSQELGNQSGHLESILPLWHGFKLASRIDGIETSVKNQLSSRLNTLNQEVAQLVAKLRQNTEWAKQPRRSLQMYDTLK